MAIKVSYVLGILNAERTLKECIDSILMQDFSKKDYEIIIIDGGSKDKTIDIVKSYMKREKCIKLFNNPNKLSEGKGNGKDQGVSRAKGEFIVFLDHDNILTNKNWLKHILEPFNDKSIMASQSLTSPQRNSCGWNDGDPGDARQARGRCAGRARVASGKWKNRP
jgi:glycosyltransferase involved in cell wall biosynthesis